MLPSNPLCVCSSPPRRLQSSRSTPAAYTADTGGSAGGQVSLISKTGTNAFHGSVFDYLRNNYFDAHGPIKTTHKVPVFQLNQFGGSLGGPIIKDRTFFFVNYEGFRQQLGGVPQTGIRAQPRPTVANWSAAQPALAFVVNAYPQGQAPTSDPNVYSFTGVVASPNSENAGTIRDRSSLHRRGLRLRPL